MQGLESELDHQPTAASALACESPGCPAASAWTLLALRSLGPESNRQAWLIAVLSRACLQIPAGISRPVTQQSLGSSDRGKHGTHPSSEQFQQKAALILDRSFALVEQ